MTDPGFVPCDQCNARAFVHVQLAGGGELAYCAHHGHQHAASLRASGATVLDLTHMLES